MKTYKVNVKAWLSEYHNISDLHKTDDVSLIVSFTNGNLGKYGATHIGDAEVTLTLFDEKTVILNKVDALRQEKDSIIAEAQAKATVIEGKIQNLLAISYTPEEA
jgi:hypothetical protein